MFHSLLAAWAPDGRTLPQDGFAELGAASGARLAAAAVDGVTDAESALASFGIAVVAEGGTPCLDGFGEYSPDCGGEQCSLRFLQPVGAAGGPDARAEERFVGVDVPDAGDGALVKEEGLDRAGGVAGCAVEIGGGEVEAVGAEGGPVGLEVGEGAEDAETAEAARVSEDQGPVPGAGLAGRLDCPHGVHMGGWRGRVGIHEELSAHAELDDQRAGGVAFSRPADEGELLAAAEDIVDDAAFEQVGRDEGRGR